MRKAKLRSIELPMKENRLIMEIFRSAIVIILLIFFYQLQTQYADTYEHQMRQCHLYHVVTRILRKDEEVLQVGSDGESMLYTMAY